MIKTSYEDDALIRSSVFEWYEVRKRVVEDRRSGRPLTTKNNENLVKVKNLSNFDRRFSARMIYAYLNLSNTNVNKIVTENLGIRK